MPSFDEMMIVSGVDVGTGIGIGVDVDVEVIGISVDINVFLGTIVAGGVLMV